MSSSVPVLKAIETIIPKSQEPPINLLSVLQAENLRLRQAVVELSVATLRLRGKASERGGQDVRGVGVSGRGTNAKVRFLHPR
jgi:hypothetical protein